MKELILLVLLLTGIGFCQVNGIIMGSGTIYTDSIGYSGSDAGDSVWTLHPDFNYNWVRVFIEGNANSPVDSLGVRFGAANKTDTLWGSWFSTMKDSAHNNCARIINNTVGKDYWFLTPAVQIVQFAILNHRGTLLTRELKLRLQFIR